MLIEVTENVGGEEVAGVRECLSMPFVKMEMIVRENIWNREVQRLVFYMRYQVIKKSWCELRHISITLSIPLIGGIKFWGEFYHGDDFFVCVCICMYQCVFSINILNFFSFDLYIFFSNLFIFKIFLLWYS